MSRYFHSIVVDKNKCSGCMKCMRTCPTEAIRVRQKLAAIMEERCIDCGKCIDICGKSAIKGLTDHLSALNDSKYKYKICLASPVLYNQFGNDVMPNDILNALLRVGFDDVYDVSYTCELYIRLIQDFLATKKKHEITISTMCPVVVRLIEFKFPHLNNLLFPMETSRGIAAMQAKLTKGKELGLKPEEICTIYITPCPAKMIPINQPQCSQISYLDSAISLADIYGQLLKALEQKDKKDKNLHKSGGIGISWGMIGGELRGLNPETSLAVDGIFNVISVLEDIDDGKINGIQYLELRTCTGGCIGGPFTVENQYRARNTIVKFMKKFGRENKADPNDLKEILAERNFYCDVTLQRQSIDMLDKDPRTALKKMKARDKIYNTLPGIDCGACGAPTCKSFAEDVVQERAKKEACLLLK